VKAHGYWPCMLGERIKYGRVCVRLRRTSTRSDAITVRTFDLWLSPTTESEDEEEDFDDSDSDDSDDDDSGDSDSVDIMEAFESGWDVDPAAEEAPPLKFDKGDRDKPVNGEVRECTQIHCVDWPGKNCFFFLKIQSNKEPFAKHDNYDDDWFMLRFIS